MVNKGLIRPYFWGGYVRGGWLTSHYFFAGKSEITVGWLMDGCSFSILFSFYEIAL